MNKGVIAALVVVLLGGVAFMLTQEKPTKEKTTPALEADVKIGVLLGFTGPIESLTPDMASGAELAMKEASDSSAFMGGSKIISVRGDSTCVDAAAATATAERLITADGASTHNGTDTICGDQPFRNRRTADHRRWCQCHYGC